MGNNLSTSTRVTGQGNSSITYQIPDFAAARKVCDSGEYFDSETCSIGGALFAIRVHPRGRLFAAGNRVSVYLRNRSQHKVIADFSITVGDCQVSARNADIGGNSSWGHKNFIDKKDVGLTLTVVVDITRLRAQLPQEAESMENLANKMAAMQAEMTKMKLEVAKTKDPIAIPGCPICFEELRPPLSIVSCGRGHKVCEPCSQREGVVSCPSCRAAFIGRDHGMEEFVRRVLGEQE